MTVTPTFTTLGEPLVAFIGERHASLRDCSRWRSVVTGAELNVAVGVARLGIDAAFIGRVGADSFGEMVRRTLGRERVRAQRLTTDPQTPTGLLFRDLPPLPPMTVEYRRDGSAGSRLCVEDLPDAITTDWLHVTGITPAISRSARDAVTTALDRASPTTSTSLDLNLRRRLWASEATMRDELLALATQVGIVFATNDELTDLSASGGSATTIRALFGAGVRQVIARHGRDGVRLHTPDGVQEVRAPEWIAAPVDPVGAGDAFVASFIAARLGGAPPHEAIEAGQAAGARVAMAAGDLDGLPYHTARGAPTGDVDR